MSDSHDHVVRIYEVDSAFVEEMAIAFTSTLAGGECVITIATAAHRIAFDSALTAAGIPLDDIVAAGRYHALDASETLDQFMIDGLPDAARFSRVIESIVDTAHLSGVPVRAFGEMVAVLWDEGNVNAAIALESLWERAIGHLGVTLTCAYPMSSLSAAGDLSAVGALCDRHAHVIVPPSYATGEPGIAIRPSADEVWQLFVPATSAIGAVRRFVRASISEWGGTDLTQDAILVASELATNAVQHARTPFRVTLTRSVLNVRIAVTDIDDVLPTLLEAPRAALGGRGVSLVAALSTAWGTEVTEEGKVVWSELVAHPTGSGPSAP